MGSGVCVGRLLFTVAVTAVFVAVVAIVITRTVTGTGHDAATVSSEPHPEMLRLQADDQITPAAILPGGRFRYHFRVTNIGDVALHNVAVRSQQVLDRSAPPRLQLLSVDDSTCAASGTVSCLFPSLPPGGSRTVQVEALAPRPRIAGDLIMIQTFVGCYVPGPDGGIDFSVIGEGEETTGRLAPAAGRPERASARRSGRVPGHERDRAGTGTKGRTGNGGRGGNTTGSGDRDTLAADGASPATGTGARAGNGADTGTVRGRISGSAPSGARARNRMRVGVPTGVPGSLHRLPARPAKSAKSAKSTESTESARSARSA